MTSTDRISKTYIMDDVEIKILVTNYVTLKNIALIAYTSEGESYCDISKNIKPVAPDHFYVDTNNNPGLDKWLEENQIAHFTNSKINSGFVEYPLYKLNQTFIDSLKPAVQSE